MVLFLTGGPLSDNRRLHRRGIRNRLQQRFVNVRVERADRRDPGPYRVIGETNSQAFLDNDSYPMTDATLSVGFDIEQSASSFDHYWINWVEPSRSLLVGWQQDDTHDELGAVHVQVNDESGPVDRDVAQFIDKHPLAVLEARLEQLPALVDAVEWHNGAPTGIDW